MKLSEVIQRLVRNRANEAHPDIELFSQTLNVYGTTGWSKTFNNRMKGWYIDSWLCTDTTVGTAVYFFDDEPVAVGTQTARKSPEVLYFLSQEAADRVRDFLLEIIQAESVNHVPYIDPETEDVTEFTFYYYGDQCGYRGRKGVWRGNPVTVCRTFRGYNFKRSPGNARCDEIEIQLPDGNKIIVCCEEVLFRINIT